MPFTRASIAFPVFCLLPVSALAGLEFCNNTDQTVSIAIGYANGETWTSEGWWVAEPGNCVSPVKGDLPLSFYYWRATARDYSWEESRFMFCTSSEVFTIEGDTDCEARGYNRSPFNEIALDGARSFTMTLNASGKAPMPGPDAPIGKAEEEPEIYDEPAAGDPGFGPDPGTYGEPYTISGILSHCDWYDAGLGCTVLSDGWSYLATSYDNTPVDTLVAMDEAGVNAPITISGDMISYEGSEALVTIREWRVGGDDSFAAIRAALQGYWTSADDAAYQLLIHGSSFEEYYDQVPTFSAVMHFGTGCTDAPGDGPSFQLVTRDGTQDRCVFVNGAGAEALDLFVAGTMRPLFFQRTD